MKPLGWIQGLAFVDNFFPAGGYAHSFGLESASHDRRLHSRKNLEDYIVTLLRFGIGTSDAVAAAVVHRAVMGDKFQKLLCADGELDSMKVCRELREGSRQMGRQVLRIGVKQLNHPYLPRIYQLMESQKSPCHYPVLLSMVLAICGWSEREAVQAYLYQTVVGWVSAALKLFPIGQEEGQGIIHALFPLIVDLAQKTEGMDLDDMNSWVPLHEVRSMVHANMEVRLFRS